MKINVHAGHNPDGKVACGAIGFIKESTEARKVKNEVIGQLRQLGNTVYDCTCDNGISQSNVLTKIVNACNTHAVDLDVSIHFNYGAFDKSGNERTTGTEVLVYSNTGKANQFAESVCASISALGFINRGVKENKTLYFLRKTKSPAILIECCFVDDKDDAQLYNSHEMAEAIVFGIVCNKVKLDYRLGEKYKTKKQCYFRLTPNGKKLTYKGLPASLKIKSASKDGYACFKSGSAFYLVDIDVSNGNIWGKIKSGYWIPLMYKGEKRVVEVKR